MITRRYRALVLGFLVSLNAFSYDIDVHFYTTYSVMRYAGIRHEVALQLAIGAEWVDESVFSSPMLPSIGYFGPRARRLFHFPGDKEFMRSSTHGARIHRWSTEATPDHPVASELLYYGFQLGDLQMVGSGLHVLADSFGHAGYSDWLGHADWGHHPDRFFLEPEKFQEMIRVMFDAATAIRMLLPEGAMDQARAAYVSADAATLTKAYLEEPEVKEIIHTNFIQKPEYVRASVLNALARAQDDGYLLSTVDIEKLADLLADGFDGKTSAEEILAKLFWRIFNPEDESVKSEELLDFAKIQDELLPGYPIRQVGFGRMDHQRQQELVNRAVTKVTRNFSPRLFNDRHKFEAEVDKAGAPRGVEMGLRMNAWRNVIDSLFGGPQFEFIAPPTLKDHWKSWVCGTERNCELPDSERAEYNLSQRFRWRYKIIKFAWGSLLDPVSLVKRAIHVYKVWPNVKIRDVISHANAHPNALIYQYPEHFKALIDSNEVKPLLTPQSLEKLLRTRAGELESQGKPSAASLLKLECDSMLRSLRP